MSINFSGFECQFKDLNQPQIIHNKLDWLLVIFLFTVKMHVLYNSLCQLTNVNKW